MLPEQQAAQLYGVGRLVHSVRSLLQLQLEQFLHPGQLKLEKQSSVTIFPTLYIRVQTKSLLHCSESSRDLCLCIAGFLYFTIAGCCSYNFSMSKRYNKTKY